MSIPENHQAETPHGLGYRWPAEWEPHAGTLLAWPHNQDTWPGNFGPIVPIYRQLIDILSTGEMVHITAGKGPIFDQAAQEVGQLKNVTLHEIPTNDAWARDHGGTFLQPPAGKRPAIIDWQYNAWGGKYAPWDDDNRVPEQLASALGYTRFEPGIVLEGGAIEGNGQGLLMTTASCVLNENRNPAMTRLAMEKIFHDYLGTTKTLWLNGTIAGDDTDGHIDQLARFVGPNKVVAAVADPADEANYLPLLENYRQLQTLTNQQDEPLEIIPLPLPQPLYHKTQRLPASYCNFYICNHAVIVPMFDDPNDQRAREVLGDCFPEREIVGLDSRDLSVGLGSFHCVSQVMV
ncbi:MAG: agmatine deiminase [Blastopirellula sp.]|nr:MAG: agmatine deiminase [Blastopirellula sp.]